MDRPGHSESSGHAWCQTCSFVGHSSLHRFEMAAVANHCSALANATTIQFLQICLAASSFQNNYFHLFLRLSGWRIPYRYFEYLRTGRTAGLAPVFHHNRLDILTLACLTSLVLAVLGDPSRAPLHAVDLVGLGGWLGKMGRADAALEVYTRALSTALPPEVAARAR